MAAWLTVLHLLFFASAWRGGRSEMVAECPPEYVRKGGTSDCYFFHNSGKRTWFDAATYCEREHGNLVRVDTSDMAAWLNNHIAQLGVTGSSAEFWIDAVFNSTTGKWYWATTGNEVNLEYLPLDSSPGSGDYGVITSDSTLLGHPAANVYHFICHRLINEPIFCDYNEGWRMSDDRCYSVSDYKDSWLDAQLTCQQMNGDLVTINNDQEHLYVLDGAVSNDDNIWIGMTEIDHAGHFYWVGDNSSDFSYWNEGMPESMDGAASAVVDVKDSSGHWMTETAFNEHSFLCERPTGSCLMGWEQFGESCYYFNRQEVDIVTGHTANGLCNDIGAHLLVIDTVAEDDYIRSKMTENDKLWIGLFYNVTAQKFEWVDGKPYTRRLTHMSQEDENAAQAEGLEKCVVSELIAASGEDEETWVPLTCMYTNGYVCEVPAGTPVYIYIPQMNQYCPEDWVLNQDSCYYGSDYEDTWTAGEAYCNIQGGHLTSVNSWDEQDIVHSLLRGDGWVGLNDRVKEGAYEWTDGNSLMIKNWDTGEPSGGEGNCIQMKINGGHWDDLMCSEQNYFVCKRDYSTTPLAPVTTTTPSPGVGSCGNGWVQDTTSGICYMVVEELLGFADARLYCQEQRVIEGQSTADIVSISTLDEQLFVQNLVGAANVQDASVFIGLKNYYNLSWTDGDPVGLLNYKVGEPNNIYYDDCTEMYNDGVYKWSDCSCAKKLPFVCEKKGLSYVAPTAPPPPTKCPKDWVYFNDFCYLVVDTLLQWEDAKSSCASMYGSTLTSILSQQETNFLLGLNLYHNYYWIGLHTDNNGSFSSWLDGNAVEFENWSYREPDNASGNEYCVRMDPYDGEWYDASCAGGYRYICKTRFKTCPEGWDQGDGKCYFIGADQRDWDGARDACKEVDVEASLLSWHSQEEVNYVQGLINNTFERTWLGLYYDDEKAWQWEDGTDADFINWRPGQPDHNDTNYCGLTVSNPQTVGFGDLENSPCINSNYFACEYFPTHVIGCEEGWFYYDSHCYYISADYGVFSEGREKCQAMDAELASVLSAEENEFVYSYIDTNYYRFYYIGIQTSTSNNLLEWTDGSPVLYTDFDSLSTSIDDTTCFTYGPYDTPHWMSFDCEESHNYVCKKNFTVTSIQPSAPGFSSEVAQASASGHVKQREEDESERDNSVG